MEKTLLLTNSFPPVVGGSAFLLYELTRHFKEDELVVIHGSNEPPIYSDLHLPFKRHQIMFLNEKMTVLLYRYFPSMYIVLIRRMIARTLRKENIKKMYIHYPNGAFTVAGFLEARKAGIPYLFYQDILWKEREKGAGLKLAEKYEKKVIEHARARIAITEFAAERQEEKYNHKFYTLPHTLDEKEIPQNFKESQNKVPKIHFAGGIYPRMNEDSIIRLINAKKSLGRNIQLEFCSPGKPQSIEQEDIEWRFLNKADLLEAQRNSDILYLPQAFVSANDQMVKYNFPTKTMEYLCSGRPILVHSPKDSYLSYLCRQEKFGYLVDEMDEQALADGIAALLDNKNLQKELVNNALDLAKRRKSSEWFLMLKGLLNSI